VSSYTSSPASIGRDSIALANELNHSRLFLSNGSMIPAVVVEGTTDLGLLGRALLCKHVIMVPGGNKQAALQLTDELRQRRSNDRPIYCVVDADFEHLDDVSDAGYPDYVVRCDHHDIETTLYSCGYITYQCSEYGLTSQQTLAHALLKPLIMEIGWTAYQNHLQNGSFDFEDLALGLARELLDDASKRPDSLVYQSLRYSGGRTFSSPQMDELKRGVIQDKKRLESHLDDSGRIWDLVNGHHLQDAIVALLEHFPPDESHSPRRTYGQVTYSENSVRSSLVDLVNTDIEGIRTSRNARVSSLRRLSLIQKLGGWETRSSCCLLKCRLVTPSGQQCNGCRTVPVSAA